MMFTAKGLCFYLKRYLFNRVTLLKILSGLNIRGVSEGSLRLCYVTSDNYRLIDLLEIIRNPSREQADSMFMCEDDGVFIDKTTGGMFVVGERGSLASLVSAACTLHGGNIYNLMNLLLYWFVLTTFMRNC